jgi:hypothetical protein
MIRCLYNPFDTSLKTSLHKEDLLIFCWLSGITPFQMMMIMAEADENEDNIIQYEEFVPVCVELLQAFRVRKRSHDSIVCPLLESNSMIWSMSKAWSPLCEVLFDARSGGSTRVPTNGVDSRSWHTQAKTEIEQDWAEMERKADKSLLDTMDANKRNLDSAIARAMSLFMGEDNSNGAQVADHTSYFPSSLFMMLS